MAQQEIKPANDEIVELKELRGGWQGVMEHLDIPSGWIDAIEKHQKEIIGCLVLAVVAVVAVTGWSAHSRSASQEAAMELSEAMTAPADTRQEKLAKVVEDYGSQSASQWALVELAHLAEKKDDFDTAVSLYQQALQKADTSSPAVPLVRLGLAGTYEKKGEMDKALEQYTKLSETKGFASEGALGMARIAEKKGNVEAARSAYEKFLAVASQASIGGGSGTQLKEFVEHKLAGLNK